MQEGCLRLFRNLDWLGADSSVVGAQTTVFIPSTTCPKHPPLQVTLVAPSTSICTLSIHPPICPSTYPSIPPIHLSIPVLMVVLLQVLRNTIGRQRTQFSGVCFHGEVVCVCVCGGNTVCKFASSKVCVCVHVRAHTCMSVSPRL